MERPAPCAHSGDWHQMLLIILTLPELIILIQPTKGDGVLGDDLRLFSLLMLFFKSIFSGRSLFPLAGLPGWGWFCHHRVCHCCSKP